MPKRKMSREDTAIWIFLILGAFGLYSAAQWLFENVISPIGDFISYLEWAIRTGEMTLFQLLLSFIILQIGIYASRKVINNILDKIRDLFNRLP